MAKSTTRILPETQKLRLKNRRKKGKNRSENPLPTNFSILGSNANGLKAKFDSLLNIINIFDKPSCITIQETKLRTQGLHGISGYQVFQLNRTGFGGGLLTAVHDDLAPVLVTADDEVELLVIQVKIGNKKVRIFNAYGPQENNTDESLNFWSTLEKEIIQSKQENCCILIQMDANAKLDSTLHEMSENGRFLLNLVRRQSLVIFNQLPICKGKVTRHRITKNGEEKAALDYIIGCDILATFVENVLIDEDRIFTLTKYTTTKGIRQKCLSDHNIMFSSFNLSYEKQVKCKVRKEQFNLKNIECQEAFKTHTEKTTKFTDIFKTKEAFEVQAQKFQRSLKQTLHCCFKKIRVRENNNKTEIGNLHNRKIKLNIFIRSSSCIKSVNAAKDKLAAIDKKIEDLTATRNAHLVQEYVKSLIINGKFSHTSMWRLRKKLHPTKQTDPPMAKHDTKGNLVTTPSLLRTLYLKTYTDRLRHREIRADFSEVFILKMKLWRLQYEKLRSKKSNPWPLKALENVLKSMKNNKSRDPHGLLNEIFKPGVCGKNLKIGILHLINGIKETFHFPEYIQWANITSIYKKSGSRLSLDNDRGIFILCVLKKIIDRMLYNDMYEEIDMNMSDSNIGGRKNKNIKNHLFIIYGIINSVVKGEAKAIDVQIYDIQKAFDALWLEESMNDLVDTIPQNKQSDRMALLYKGNEKNLVAINTAVGQTVRVDIPRIVMQGGTWGSLMCSNSIDKIGKKCHETGEHLYTYKNRVKILPFGMVDDLLAVSECGQKAVAMNTFLTAQGELKKLKFHIPDKITKKSKCHKLHIGQKNFTCPELKVHGHVMETVSTEKYLGDILSSNGTNDATLQDRKGKAIGCMNNIISILDTISFGHHYFNILILLRESMFINCILTNSEVWYGLKENDLKELEKIDRMLLRKALRCPISTPKEAYYLELGILNINCIVKQRRINYLHYLLKTDKRSMLYKFFEAMYEKPTKDDWIELVTKDLTDFGIKDDFKAIESKSKSSFKNVVKIKAKEFALEQLNMMKFKHTKLDNLVHTELCTQDYLLSTDLSTEQKRNLFLFRTRMANFSNNFKNQSGNLAQMCKMCSLFPDSQTHSVNCLETMKHVRTKGNYEEIFTNNISRETAIMITQIVEVRKNKLD